MAKIVVTFEYEPVMENYPDSVKTFADALRCDVEDYRAGKLSLGELLDESLGDVTIEVVE